MDGYNCNVNDGLCPEFTDKIRGLNITNKELETESSNLTRKLNLQISGTPLMRLKEDAEKRGKEEKKKRKRTEKKVGKAEQVARDHAWNR